MIWLFATYMMFLEQHVGGGDVATVIFGRQLCFDVIHPALNVLALTVELQRLSSKHGDSHDSKNFTICGFSKQVNV